MFPTRILVPILDDSPSSHEVIEYAGFLADTYDAKVEVLYVAERTSMSGRCSPDDLMHLRSVLERGEEMVRGMCEESEWEAVKGALVHVMAGDPRDVITRFGSVGYDMILLSESIDLATEQEADGVVDVLLNPAGEARSLPC